LGSSVRCIAELDSEELGDRHQDLIRVLVRNLEIPIGQPSVEQLEAIVLGQVSPSEAVLTEADVQEALAALKRNCNSKWELRYQLAAAVVLNAWIESERKLGFGKRKKFYAFKQRVDALVRWAVAAELPGVKCWTEPLPGAGTPILYVRIDNVDFSFHAIPVASSLPSKNDSIIAWSRVRLKPIAPFVLAWARSCR
jgi:hypothetical protein